MTDPMTDPTPYIPGPAQSPFVGPSPIQQPPAPRRRTWPFVAAIVVLAVALAGVLAWPHVKPGHSKPSAPASLTQTTAQRACRTAFGTEWDSRNQKADTNDVVASVQGIDLQETWQVAGGWSVNGVVHYSVTTGFIDPVQDTLDLTCTATGTEANPSTSVTNRS